MTGAQHPNSRAIAEAGNRLELGSLLDRWTSSVTARQESQREENDALVEVAMALSLDIDAATYSTDARVRAVVDRLRTMASLALSSSTANAAMYSAIIQALVCPVDPIVMSAAIHAADVAYRASKRVPATIRSDQPEPHPRRNRPTAV